MGPTSGTCELVPEKLATFYREVGGNYDTLFLSTKGPSLSFIYQSLGCFHTLQPTTNPFEPPSIPALLPSGFVRWHTIQLLLCPDEHCKYLQNAVEKWDVPNPNGGTFPKTIPRDAFPPTPDPEMVEWHERVSQRLERDYQHVHSPYAAPADFIRTHASRAAEADYFSRTSRRPVPSSSRSGSQDGMRPPRRRMSTEGRPPGPHRHEGPCRYDDPPSRGGPSRRHDSDSPHSGTSPPPGDRPRRAKTVRVGKEEPSGPFAALKKRVPKFTFGLVSSASDSSNEEPVSSRRRGSIDDKRPGRSQHLSPAREPLARRHSHDNTDRRPGYVHVRDSYSPNPKREREALRHARTTPGPHVRYDDIGASRFSRLPGARVPDYVADGFERRSSTGNSPPGSGGSRMKSPPPPGSRPRHKNSDPLPSTDENRRSSFHERSPSAARHSGSSDNERPRSMSHSGPVPLGGNRWASPARQARRVYA